MTTEQGYACPICGDGITTRHYQKEIDRLTELLESSRQVAEQRRQEIARLKQQLSSVATGYEVN